MTIKRIIKFPAPSLRKPCREVLFPLSDELLEHLQDLRDTLAATPNGLALASNQITADGWRVFVVKPGTKLPNVVINPTWKSIPFDTESGDLHGVRYEDEGCLSIPEFNTRVKRFSLVEIECKDDTGQVIIQRVIKLDARIVQHECEHLDGKLIVDNLSLKERIALHNKVVKNRKQGR